MIKCCANCIYDHLLKGEGGRRIESVCENDKCGSMGIECWNNDYDYFEQKED
jgi:hypothetical protein